MLQLHIGEEIYSGLIFTEKKDCDEFSLTFCKNYNGILVYCGFNNSANFLW